MPNVDLAHFDMDSPLRLMQPSGTPDGARQIVLPLYNTQVSVKALPGTRNLTPEQLDAALCALRDVAIEFEMSLSRTRPTSEITLLNNAGGTWVELSPRTFDLVEKSRAYCEASGGVFDVTMGAVTPLWNFHEGVVPTREQLDAALAHVGWQAIEVDPATRSVRLADPRARPELEAIVIGTDGRVRVTSGLADCVQLVGA